MPIDEIKDVPMREWSIENRIDEALVENERAKQQRELGDFTKSDRMSSAGKCVRDRWARLNNIPIDSDRISTSRGLKLMMLGNLYEQFVLDLLEMAKITVHSQQLEVGVVPFLGHIDGIIELDRVSGPTESLLEIKSTGSKQMDRLYEHGYAKWNPSYLAQLQVYMHALGLEDAIVIVVSRDDANIYAERVLYDLSLALDLLDKSLLATSEAMPERPPEARGPSSKYCYWCQRVDWCYDPATGWDPERRSRARRGRRITSSRPRGSCPREPRKCSLHCASRSGQSPAARSPSTRGSTARGSGSPNSSGPCSPFAAAPADARSPSETQPRGGQSHETPTEHRSDHRVLDYRDLLHLVGARTRRDEVALDELVSYERDSERRPTTCWCNRCGEEYVVYSNRITQYHLRFQVCSRCAAKEAARKFPTMSVRQKMNGVARWPVLH